jgi:hypothetical protein
MAISGKPSHLASSAFFAVKKVWLTADYDFCSNADWQTVIFCGRNQFQSLQKSLSAQT